MVVRVRAKSRHDEYWAADSLDAVRVQLVELGDNLRSTELEVIADPELSSLRLRLLNVASDSVRQGRGPFLLISPDQRFYPFYANPASIA